MNAATPERRPATEQIPGLIERVTFHNDESGFCVLRVKVSGQRDDVTVVGSLPSVTAGEWLAAEGWWVRDKEHGLQFFCYADRIMIETVIRYPTEQRKLFLEGFLYSRWKRKYARTVIFGEYLVVEPTTKQIPVSHPPLKTQRYGFGELFTAIHYIERRYNVSCDYWGKNWDCPSYFRAIKILGLQTAAFICKAHPQPPDLFVTDRKGRFFFVEAKLPADRLNVNQIKFFRRIERYLNKNVPQNKRAPYMPERHWIELVRLEPHLE